MQDRNILQWTVVFTARYRKSDYWTMETVYSELKAGKLLILRRNMMLSDDVSKD